MGVCEQVPGDLFGLLRELQVEQHRCIHGKSRREAPEEVRTLERCEVPEDVEHDDTAHLLRKWSLQSTLGPDGDSIAPSRVRAEPSE